MDTYPKCPLRENDFLPARCPDGHNRTLTPEQTFDSQALYPTLEDKTAILFYLLAKSHPFMNGNKRLAVTALTVFLFLNGKWITVSPNDLSEFTIAVAASESRDKDRTLTIIKDFLDQYMADSLGSPGMRSFSIEG